MTLPAGLHYDVHDAVYRADPCAERSLTQSIAKTLLTLTPAHARHMRAEPTTKFDIGHIAHRLLLGRGRELVPMAFDDWRTKAAREAREEAEAVGQLAVLEKDYATGDQMTEAAFRQLIVDRPYAADWDTDDTDPPRAEVVAIARVDGPIHEFMGDGGPSLDPPVIGHHWLRALIDWLPSLTRVWDLKTSSMSCARATAVSLPDWCIQAAMHERILNLIDPDNAGRREHRFVVQENFEPYALQVVRLTEAHMTIGRAQIARAEAIWARCMATGEWPAYPIEDATPEYPAWKMAQVIEGQTDD